MRIAVDSRPRVVLMLFVALAMIGSLSLHTPTSASATAFGSQAVGSFSYSNKGVTISVPTGCFLNHKIDGDGRVITKQFAAVDCAGPAALHPGLFCNYNFKYTYSDANTGKVYKTYNTKVVNACHTITNSGVAPAQTVPKYGQACVQLMVNGVGRTKQCHSIVK